MTKHLISASIAALLMGALTTAHAVPTLSVKLDSGPTIECADGADCDGSAAEGVVMFNYSGGDFLMSVTTGFGQPVYTDGNPLMHLNTVNLQVYGPGHTLLIKFSDTDYQLPGLFGAEYGGLLSGSGATLAYGAYYDAGNTLFGEGTLIGEVGPLGSGQFSGAVSNGQAPDSPYSVTQVLTLKTTGAITTFSGDFEISVPEPTTLALLGLSLGLAGFAIRRQQRPS